MTNICPLCTYNDDKTKLMFAPSGATSVQIAASVETIFGSGSSDYAFYPCRSTLESFSFESNSRLTTISQYAFYRCSKLKIINLSMCVQLNSIGGDAFNGCTSAIEVYLPSGITSIGTYAFAYNNFTTITLPNSITSIGEYAFGHNSALTDLIFQKGSIIKTLPNYLISNSNSIEELTVPKSVTSIGSFVEFCKGIQRFYVEDGNSIYVAEDGIIFSKDKLTLFFFPPGRKGSVSLKGNFEKIYWCSFICSQLSTLTMPNTVTYIGEYAFKESLISEIQLSTALKQIDNYAFYGCTNLKSISFPNSLNNIGGSAFYSCSKLSSVSIPSTLSILGGGSFMNCSSDIVIDFNGNPYFTMTNKKYVTNSDETEILMYLGSEKIINIENKVTNIKNNAFSYMDITTVSFDIDNSQLSEIQSYAFYMCKSLISFAFPKNLKTIGYRSFESCEHLEIVNINSQITLVDRLSFRFCYALKELRILNAGVLEIGNDAFISCTSLKTVEITGGLKKIGYNVFKDCKVLTSIQLPEKLETIDEYAFYNTGLTSVTIPSNSLLATIANYAFSGCSKLTSFSFPMNLKIIGNYAFFSNALTSVTIPASVTSIGDFCFSKCKSLEDFIIEPNSQLSNIGFGVWTECSSFANIQNGSPNFDIVNNALFDIGKTTFYVLTPKSSTKYFSFPETLEVIRQSALQECRNLEVIFLPTNKKLEINRQAFQDCSSLKQINIPSSVTLNGADIFKGCVNLVCSLSIERRDSKYLEDLVSIYKMPKKCIQPCIVKCTAQCRRKLSVAILLCSSLAK